MNHLTDLFGSMVFNEKAMKRYLSEDVCRALKRTIDTGAPMNLETADAVAEAMKNWATDWARPTTPTGSSPTRATRRRSTRASSPTTARTA